MHHHACTSHHLDHARFAHFFRAIGDETRQRILLLLQDKERCVSELVDEFDLSQPSISRHLSVLRHAGLVSSRRDGQQVVYSLAGEEMRDRCREFFCCFQECGCLFSEGE